VKIIFVLIFAFVGVQLYAPPAKIEAPRERLPESADRYLINPKYFRIVMEEAAAAHILLDVATGLMWSESGNASRFCVGISGDEGKFQLNPRYHDWMVQEFNDGQDFDPFDLRANAHVGMRYLAYCLKITKTLRGAVEAYKAGPSGWARGVSASTAYSARMVMDMEQ
jgi:soluble lytic murein transglycosylase-like protein